MTKAIEKFDISVFAEVFSLLGNLLFEEVGFEDLKLTKMEILELVIIAANEGMTMSELARQIGTSKVQISRSIAGLKKLGLSFAKPMKRIGAASMSLCVKREENCLVAKTTN